ARYTAPIPPAPSSSPTMYRPIRSPATGAAPRGTPAPGTVESIAGDSVRSRTCIVIATTRRHAGHASMWRLGASAASPASRPSTSSWTVVSSRQLTRQRYHARALPAVLVRRVGGELQLVNGELERVFGLRRVSVEVELVRLLRRRDPVERAVGLLAGSLEVRM